MFFFELYAFILLTSTLVLGICSGPSRVLITIDLEELLTQAPNLVDIVHTSHVHIMFTYVHMSHTRPHSLGFFDVDPSAEMIIHEAI